MASNRRQCRSRPGTQAVPEPRRVPVVAALSRHEVPNGRFDDGQPRFDRRLPGGTGVEQ